MEIENIFNPEKNSSFQHGNARRWILTREDQASSSDGLQPFMIGTSVFKITSQPGGSGFFECINDQSSANLLFDTAKNWLASEGMQAMDGPINFGENFVNWGLLVEGFMQQGYGMPYNFPYYRQLFENYGFKTYFEQY